MTEAPKYASMNGELVPYADARIHVMTPAVNYAANVFEGIRGYWNEEKQEMALFRLEEHLARLQISMRMMYFEDAPPSDLLREKLLELLRACEFREDIHIRLNAYVDGEGRVASTGPVGYYIVARRRGREKTTEGGWNCAVSSWRRLGDNAVPPRIKATGTYINSRLAALQVKKAGYDFPIMLTERGTLAEGASQTLFLVLRGQLTTPSVTSGILEGITRQTVIDLAQGTMGLETAEREIDRTELYQASEAFFCGTGHEIGPITKVDDIPIGTGAPGEITLALKRHYGEAVHGRLSEYSDWLTVV